MSQRANEELVQAVIDGRMNDSDFDAFQERLRNEEPLRKLYYDYSRMSHALHEQFEGEAQLPKSIPTLRDYTAPKRSLGPAVLAAAATLMLLAVAAWFIVVREPKSTGMVAFGPEAFGEIVHAKDGRRSTTELKPGSRLSLERGTVELTLASGVKGVIEGPATLQSISDDELLLARGRAWFHVPPGVESFTCTTSTLEVIDLGTEFGVIAGAGSMEEVHVIKGRVQVQPLDRSAAPRELGKDDAVAWNGREFAQPATKCRFMTALPHKVDVLVDDFSEEDETRLQGKSPDTGKAVWEVIEGDPMIFNQVLDTSGHAKTAFAPLGENLLDDMNHVLLVTVKTENPDARTFHTEGWAGVSLFTGDEERIFVGDPGGLVDSPEIGWAIHPQGGFPVAPSPPLMGKRTVTLRYDYRTGLVQLFEGGDTTGVALASEHIMPGLSFDRLRIANGEGGDIAIDLLRVAVLASE